MITYIYSHDHHQIGWYSEDEGLNISPAFPLRSKSNLPTTTTERLTAPRSSPLIR